MNPVVSPLESSVLAAPPSRDSIVPATLLSTELTAPPARDSIVPATPLSTELTAPLVWVPSASSTLLIILVNGLLGTKPSPAAGVVVSTSLLSSAAATWSGSSLASLL
uniref:Uncharacterized protein n=1 Tax=Cacopsylla melanoneura TaxID=428564 RepID=A0A8D8TP68_9HEMI